MKRIFSCILFGLLTTGGAAFSNSSPPDKSLPDLNLSKEVNSGGQFKYEVGFDLPEIRGLLPNFGLRYGSQTQGTSPSNAFLAVGWHASGFSSIERTSVGGGAPTFDNSVDVFRLDGEVLLACKDSSSTNSWTENYPSEFQTNVASASCSTGGNMASLRENYLRVTATGVSSGTYNSKFVLERGDGTIFTYTSLGDLASILINGDTEASNLAFSSRWLLTEISDRQTKNNSIKISYDIAPMDDGFAARPKTIEYGEISVYPSESNMDARSYRVTYGYKSAPNVRTFGTGTRFWGQSRHLLDRVTIDLRDTSSGNKISNIRAYQFEYDQSPEVGTRRLTKVKQFGSNYVEGASTVTGSQLPSWQFGYSSDSLSFQDVGAGSVGSTFHTNMTIVNTGLPFFKDEILAHEKRWVWDDYGYSSPTYIKIPAATYNVGAQRVITKNTGNAVPEFMRMNAQTSGYIPPHGDHKVRPTAYLNADVMANGIINDGIGLAPISISDGYDNENGNPLFAERLATFRIGAMNNSLQNTYDWKHGHCEYGNVTLVGNFDSDRESEYILNEKVYDFNPVSQKMEHNSSMSGELHKNLCNYSYASIFRKNGYGVGDIDGDGQDEIIGSNAYLDFRDGLFIWREMANSPFDSIASVTNTTFGDINGDGLADAVTDRRNPDKLYVRLSTGHGFLPRTEFWASTANRPNFLGDGNTNPLTRIADVNGDGFGDFIFHHSLNQTPSGGGNVANDEGSTQEAYIFLSDGTSFYRPNDPNAFVLPQFLGTGDFDGDGMLDAVSKRLGNGQNGIRFGNGVAPNLLTTVTDQKGGITNIAYAPSTKVASSDNRFPKISFLVESVTRSNGFTGLDRTVSYSYAGGNYDYEFRKSMGFETVTATLEPAIGETHPTQVVTTYSHNHFGETGLVKSRTVISNNIAFAQTVNSYVSSAETARPLKSVLAKVEEKSRWSTQLVTKTTEYLRNNFGQLTHVRNLGFSGSQDDVTTAFGYSPNLQDYITAKPSWKFVGTGTDVTWGDRSNYIYGEKYYYDGATSHTTAPNRGNRTGLLVWDGNKLAHNGRIVSRSGFDDRGNVIWSEDGEGNRSNFTYDNHFKLFVESTQNALGQTMSGQWNEICAAPSQQTDMNGQVTTISYDVFCRETVKNLPNGQVSSTSYHSIGDPDAQYIRTYQKSNSATSGMAYTSNREYFDGFGEVYKTVMSGTTDARSNLANASAVLTGYDKRGNVAWTSLPKPALEATTRDVAENLKTKFTYDTLGRLRSTTLPDGNRSTVNYARTAFTNLSGHNTGWLNTVYRDAHCYDSAAAGTECGLKTVAVDAEGRPLREVLYDYPLTDVDSGTAVSRATHYQYDNLGQLIKIRDPQSTYFTYTYDTYGNRITANDPALGIWQMEYDANGNLTRQTDAKSQVIEFTYDALNRPTLKRVNPGANRADTHYVYDEVRSGFYNIGQLTSQDIWTSADGTYHGIEFNYDKIANLDKEQHDIDGRVYTLDYTRTYSGDIRQISTPITPGSTSSTWHGDASFDAANRMVSSAWGIDSIQYDIQNNPVQIDYANGAKVENDFDPVRGWQNRSDVYNASSQRIDRTQYTRSATGRVQSTWTERAEGRFNYEYDYAGRLLSATNTGGQPAYSQTFSYDKGGRMRSNSKVGTYSYSSHKFAPHSVASQSLSYDANGNMTGALNGRTITYDGENRPLSVSYGGATTEYVYGATGDRLKKIEYSSNQQPVETAYFGPVEIRNYGEGTNEEMITYLSPDVRLVNGAPSYMHSDQLGSVRTITNAAGQLGKITTHRPFGETNDVISDLLLEEETKGFIGERFDEDAGLQYLNARYYDPEMGIFIQPD